MKFFKSMMIATALTAASLASPALADGPRMIGGSGIQGSGVATSGGFGSSFGRHTENFSESTGSATLSLGQKGCGCGTGRLTVQAGQLTQAYGAGPGHSGAGSTAFAGVQGQLSSMGGQMPRPRR